ncbi:hypothetical protein IAU59_001778 [Kwoniella sp. CBS 9459]
MSEPSNHAEDVASTDLRSTTRPSTSQSSQRASSHHEQSSSAPTASPSTEPTRPSVAFNTRGFRPDDDDLEAGPRRPPAVHFVDPSFASRNTYTVDQNGSDVARFASEQGSAPPSDSNRNTHRAIAGTGLAVTALAVFTGGLQLTRHLREDPGGSEDGGS